MLMKNGVTFSHGPCTSLFIEANATYALASSFPGLMHSQSQFRFSSCQSNSSTTESRKVSKVPCFFRPPPMKLEDTTILSAFCLILDPHTTTSQHSRSIYHHNKQ